MDKFTVLVSTSRNEADPTIVDTKLNKTRRECVAFIETQIEVLIKDRGCEPEIKESNDVSFLSFPDRTRVWFVVSPV